MIFCNHLRWAKFLICTLLALIIFSSYASAANTSDTTNDLNIMENRYFFRIYARDPIEKRLERLELLVFGGIQSGTANERIERLKKTIIIRDQASSHKFKHPETASKSPANSFSHYPILSTLEWRALKKTFPDETIDQRLERLETKLFGSSSNAMSYADRVDRLKKILGVGAAQNLPPRKSGPLGPMPKAQAHPPDSFGEMPPLDFNAPFNSLPPSFGSIPDISNMFQQFEQQWEQLSKMPSGIWEWDSKTGTWVPRKNGNGKANPGQKSLPFNPPNLLPLAPYIQHHQKPAIPPYGDPNSI